MNQIKTKSSILLACGLALVALPCAFAEDAIGHSADAMFKAADSNNDGKLSRAEHAIHGKKVFTDTDTNRDGTVTLTEMTAAHAKMKTDMTMQTDATKKADQADRFANAGKGAMDEMSPAAMIKMHDTNKDGQLSAAEQTAGCDAMFTKMDTNKDGSLSKDECKEGNKVMQGAY